MEDLGEEMGEDDLEDDVDGDDKSKDDDIDYNTVIQPEVQSSDSEEDIIASTIKNRSKAPPIDVEPKSSQKKQKVEENYQVGASLKKD